MISNQICTLGTQRIDPHIWSIFFMASVNCEEHPGCIHCFWSSIEKSGLNFLNQADFSKSAHSGKKIIGVSLFCTPKNSYIVLLLGQFVSFPPSTGGLDHEISYGVFFGKLTWVDFCWFISTVILP